MIVGVLFLIVYYEVLQCGAAMVERGTIGPGIGLWTPFAIFAVCSLWLFWLADRRPGQDPLGHMFEGLNTAMEWLRRLLWRRRGRRAAAE